MSVGWAARAAVVALAGIGSACGSTAGPAAAPEPAPTRPRPSRPAQLVRLTLLADVARVAPGQELTLGARFDVAPGWHIYWTNPGESGLATEATFTAPTGFQVGTTRFPGPTSFESPGDITSYGYEELVMLTSRVAAPKTMGGERVRFSVQASWLACRDVCVPGRGEAEMELEAARAGEPSRPAHAELFARQASALPRPLGELGAAAATPRWRRDEHQVAVALEVPGAERLEYFPASGEDLGLTGQASVPTGAGLRIELSYRPAPRPLRLGGVLAVTKAHAVRYYAVDLEESPR